MLRFICNVIFISNCFKSGFPKALYMQCLPGYRPSLLVKHFAKFSLIVSALADARLKALPTLVLLNALHSSLISSLHSPGIVVPDASFESTSLMEDIVYYLLTSKIYVDRHMLWLCCLLRMAML